MSSQSLLSELGLLNVLLITLKLIACVTAINSMTFTCLVINKNIYNYVVFNPSIFFTTFPPKRHRGRRHNVSDRIRLAHLQSIVDRQSTTRSRFHTYAQMRTILSYSTCMFKACGKQSMQALDEDS